MTDTALIHKYKKSDYNFGVGSLLDQAGGTETLVNNGSALFAKNEKGRVMKFVTGSSQYFTVSDANTNSIFDFGTNDFAIEMWVRLSDLGADQMLWQKKVGSGGTANGITINIEGSNGKLRFAVDARANAGNFLSVDTTAAIDDNLWHHVVAFYDADGNMEWYIDGVSGSGTQAAEGISTDNTGIFYLSSQGGSSKFIDGFVARTRVYDFGSGGLTTAIKTGIATAGFAEFNQTNQVLSPPVRGFRTNKEINADASGLISGYQYAGPNANKTLDIKGVNNGTVTGAILFTKDGLKFGDGATDKIALGNVGNIKSMSFRIKLDTTTEQILEGAANAKLILASSGTLTYAEFDNAFIDGVDTNTVVAGQWHNIVIVSSTDVDMTALTLALNNATYGDFEIANLQFYSTELTLAQAKEINNEWARKATLVERFKYGADGAVKNIPNWQINAGTWSIGDTIDGSYLECATAGQIAIPSNMAYGTFEFDLYKDLDASTTTVRFISDENSAVNSGNSYNINFTATEEIELSETTTGTEASLMASAAAGMTIQTFTTIKVTRTLDGEMTVYKDGVAVTASSGTNPVTDTTLTASSFFTIDCDAGDRIKNITLTQGVIQ